ncbi:L-glutaminase [Aneurinibacillus thermoaerophilus]|uniref:Glutaminase n=1 Tax=Aneurinibacillus thermoaerophilus TaxID=143495 RepID=A0A1G7Y3X0_ANETH|nr:glutaminase [Aneurinibacillus thermoaerophilus]SDG90946.1 L-glutaminase [Aneurinibacillus thermoaerophilus]
MDDNRYQTEDKCVEQLCCWVRQYRKYTLEGACASYIPALQHVNQSQLGICIIGHNGEVIKAGEADVTFTMQSISKVISFMAVCLDKGVSYALERVDVEPTGDPYNSIMRLELKKPSKPFNPMINAGAITIASLLPGTTKEEKFDSLLELLAKLLGRHPKVDETVFMSEWNTAHYNFALAHFLKAEGFLECEVEEALYVYLRQCAIEVTTEDLARIGLILACDGYHPLKEKQMIHPELARLTKAIMLTCGMYNASGKFAAFVGAPSKSGVSGGIMTAVPSRIHKATPFHNGCGIGIYGPAIDKAGNSVAGVKLLEHISKEWELSVF